MVNARWLDLEIVQGPQRSEIAEALATLVTLNPRKLTFTSKTGKNHEIAVTSCVAIGSEGRLGLRGRGAPDGLWWHPEKQEGEFYDDSH